MSYRSLRALGLQLDEYGRVVLDDDLLAAVSALDVSVTIAGGASNSACANGSCNNSGCSNPLQTNDWCTNTGCGNVNNLHCQNRIFDVYA
jgi:hypothetical protein